MSAEQTRTPDEERLQAELRELAQEMFRPDMASLSAVGQVGEPEDYARWLGMSS